MVILKTNFGDIHLELDHTNTPITTANFLQYAKDGFYDGTIFHRVISGFMIQGGGFTEGMEQKQTGETIKNEAKSGGKNKIGAIAMARTQDPHSATAQFFINVANNGFLDFTKESIDGWWYCIFGNVVEGMDIVNKIAKVETTARRGHQDVPVEEIVIEEVILDDETIPEIPTI